MNRQRLSFTVNGRPRKVEAYPIERLLDVLREDLGLTGTKEGCGEGECGACSVLLNGELVNSCLVPIAQVNETDIVTIESIAVGVNLHPVQQAFLACGGAQCGMCTPGMIVAATYLLNKCPHPSPEQIREGLNGNLCRCTGFMRIFEAVEKAAQLGAGE